MKKHNQAGTNETNATEGANATPEVTPVTDAGGTRTMSSNPEILRDRLNELEEKLLAQGVVLEAIAGLLKQAKVARRDGPAVNPLPALVAAIQKVRHDTGHSPDASLQGLAD